MDDLAAEFAECCGYQRWFVDEGWVSKQVAVDNCELLARRGGYDEALGVDQCQRIMSAAFAPMPDLPSDYVQQRLMEWELADPRDRWKWTGEPRPAPERREWPARKPYSTPQSTIDAFQVVLQSADQDRISAWIRNHPDDASVLVKLVEAA